MTKTTNYQLNQWAKSDRIMMEDFNADNQKIDAAIPRIIFGTYTGNGANSQLITLSRRPRALFGLPDEGISRQQSGGLVIDGEVCRYGTEYPVLTIEDSGFKAYYKYLGSTSSIGTNTKNCKYFYVALL